MPIPFSCSCGKSFRLADDLAGKRVRCPQCQTVHEVPKTALMPSVAAGGPAKTPLAAASVSGTLSAKTAPAKTPSADDMALAFLMDGQPASKPSPAPAPAVANTSPPVREPVVRKPAEAATPARTLPKTVTAPPSPPKKPEKKKKKKKEDWRASPLISTEDRGSYWSRAAPGLLVGFLMMAGGALWLALGLLANRLFWYAGVLIVLGFVKMVKGLFGEEDA